MYLPLLRLSLLFDNFIYIYMYKAFWLFFPPILSYLLTPIPVPSSFLSQIHKFQFSLIAVTSRYTPEGNDFSTFLVRSKEIVQQ